MFDQKRAAEYLVVAWCKNWTMTEYLKVVLERPKLCEAGDLDGFAAVVDAACDAFPWLSKNHRIYPRSAREFVAGAYPKLSQWLWSRADDLARLKCAPQIEKLHAPAALVRYVSDQDRADMKAATRDERQATASYRMSRDSFKTQQRSAWNVCKA